MSRNIAPMQILRKQLSELTPADYNPRSITDAALKGLRASIQRFGLVEPIIWNERTGNVVGGHQRLKVLIADGEVGTDVVVVDLPAVEERALNVALNNPAIGGDFTDEIRDIIAELSMSIPDAVADLRLGEILDGNIASVPDFAPTDEPGARLDELADKSVECPECGHHFEP